MKGLKIEIGEQRLHEAWKDPAMDSVGQTVVQIAVHEVSKCSGRVQSYINTTLITKPVLTLEMDYESEGTTAV